MSSARIFLLIFVCLLTSCASISPMTETPKVTEGEFHESHFVNFYKPEYQWGNYER